MKKNHIWMFVSILFCGIFLFSACASEIDNPSSADDNDGLVEGMNLMVDPTASWKHCDAPTYFVGIGSKPLPLQQALSMIFPNKVNSLDEAKIVVADMITGLKIDNIIDFYDKGGLIILLPTKAEDASDMLGYEDVGEWDELLFATHNGIDPDDHFFMLDEKDEVTSIDENGNETKRTIVKDLNYYNDRLTALVDWIEWYEEEFDNQASESRKLTRGNTRGDDMPDFDHLKLSLAKDFKHYSINFPFSLKKVIDKATWSEPDVLDCHGSVTLRFDVLPLYMNSANGDNAGDYYAIRSVVVPHNSSMWRPFVGKHGGTRNRVYGYWFCDMDYQFALVDPSNMNTVDGLKFAYYPFPENSIKARNNSNEFTFNLNGSLTVGAELSKDGPSAKAEASFGFFCEWKDVMSYELANIDYDRNSSTNMVKYRWYSNNVLYEDDMDNYVKYFPDDVHKEFEAKNVWMWQVPYGKAGVEDESEKQFHLMAYVHPRYSSWYHWRWTATFDDNRRDWDVDFSGNYKSDDKVINPDFGKRGWVGFSFKLPAPDREKWGLISLKNASNSYVMRNVKIYKTGSDTPTTTIANTFAPKESAEKAVREGSYTVTFEFINPDNNKVTAKGMLKNVKVNIGKDRSEATTSISTGDAELEVM